MVSFRIDSRSNGFGVRMLTGASQGQRHRQARPPRRRRHERLLQHRPSPFCPSSSSWRALHILSVGILRKVTQDLGSGSRAYSRLCSVVTSSSSSSSTSSSTARAAAAAPLAFLPFLPFFPLAGSWLSDQFPGSKILRDMVRHTRAVSSTYRNRKVSINLQVNI